MKIQNLEYTVLGVYNNSITLPDSFAAQGNKFGKGHGEAKLYIGTKSMMNSFFGQDAACFVLKEDFINYKRSLDSAQSVLTSIYKKSISKNKNFTAILNNINSIISGMVDVETFEIKLKNNLKGPRGYISTNRKNKKNGYQYLRDCCIPFISFIRILKLKEVSTGKVCFYIKLFPNFDEMYQQVQYIKKYGKQKLSGKSLARPGQIKYKRGLVEEFGKCPFTNIQDERLLVASHIKPFASCTQTQKYDVANGLLLSPLYDKLFDRGFISFDQQGNLKKTIWLSSSEWEKINLDYNPVDLRLTDERKAYLQFHETHVFLGD